MRKYLLSAAVVAMLAGAASYLTGSSLLDATAQAQNTAAEAALPHKVGLIDMSHIFKHYKKFEALREDLKLEIEGADKEAQARAAQIQKRQNELKDKDYPYKPGSPQYTQLEDEITRSVAEFESFRKKNQRDFLQKEANIYKTVYLEVSHMCGLYAKAFKYTLILRFNREQVQEAENAQEILNGMNRQVVFHQPQDDITLDVLNELNKRYPQSTVPRSAAQPGGNTRRN